MNINGKLKVFNVKVNEKNVTARGSESKKKQDGEWESKWYNIKFVGKSVDLAKQIQDKDKINITSAILDSVDYEKDGQKKNWTGIVVFEFEKEEAITQQTNDMFSTINDPDLPF